MNQNAAEIKPAPWSEDMLWALSLLENAVLLVDADRTLRHANASANLLAERIFGAGTPPETLLQLLPAGVWDEACAQQRWRGEVQPHDRALVLEIAVYCGTHHGVERRFVVLDDVTARAARELELTRRHDELERTYKSLASAQEQLLQTEKMASIGQLAAGVRNESHTPSGYGNSNPGTLGDYAASLIRLLEA